MAHQEASPPHPSALSLGHQGGRRIVGGELCWESSAHAGRGSLHAANTADSGVPPIRVRDSVTIPFVFHPDNRVRNITIMVVSKLPYGLILRANFFRAN